MSEPHRYIEPPLYFRQVQHLAGETRTSAARNETYDLADEDVPDTVRYLLVTRRNRELEMTHVRQFWLTQFLSQGKTIEEYHGYKPTI